jgi:hypothetical protein
LDRLLRYYHPTVPGPLGGERRQALDACIAAPVRPLRPTPLASRSADDRLEDMGARTELDAADPGGGTVGMAIFPGSTERRAR